VHETKPILYFKEIGSEAFCATELQTVTFPKTIETLSRCCFAGIESLELLNFGDGK
jgi:hypothetical protein